MSSTRTDKIISFIRKYPRAIITIIFIIEAIPTFITSYLVGCVIAKTYLRLFPSPRRNISVGITMTIIPIRRKRITYTEQTQAKRRLHKFQ